MVLVFSKEECEFLVFLLGKQQQTTHIMVAKL